MNSMPASASNSMPSGVPGRKPAKAGSHVVIWLVAPLWLATILMAMAWMTNYSYTPGPSAGIPPTWPKASGIQRATTHPTLLLFAHPRCPCTRATLEELARLAARCQGHFTAQVWFTKPAGVASNWTDTDLWRTAAIIPGVSVHADEVGREAALFRAQTSGHAMLFNQRGQLLFEGGITVSRGHAGDNLGRSTLEELLEGVVPAVNHTPVFGCALFTPSSNEEVACKR